MMEAQCATIELDGKVSFVKGGILGIPPLAFTQNLKDLLHDIDAGKLSVRVQNSVNIEEKILLSHHSLSVERLRAKN